jgi:putative FmdB family regulatory protein
MPDDEDECQECKKTFTVHQTVAEHEASPTQECPSCKGPNVVQLFSGVAVITSKKT